MGISRIYIVDDYPLIREGMKKVIRDLSQAVIVGESNGMVGLAQKVKASSADILLMELNLCDRPVKELMAELKSVSPKTQVLVISDCVCELPIISAIRAGISGFIKKNVTKDELMSAILSISQGVPFYSQTITQVLTNGYFSDKPEMTFSDREIEVLRYICKGRSNEQISDLLFISEKTAATHKKNIMKKAGKKKTSDLIIWALENKLVQT